VTPREAGRAAGAFLLLPLSLVPLYFAVPRLRSGDAGPPQERRALAIPAIHPTRTQLEHWRTVPAYQGAVPVLAYHGINDQRDHYSVKQADFTEQMAMLKRGGFHTISIGQYVRFLAGDFSGLPERPILITFDDGRLDSYRGADKALAAYGFRATMFVIVGQVEQRTPFYLRWDELRRMSLSGRWDIQEHAGVGHVNIPYDAAGHMGPAYAFRRMYENGHLESFRDFRKRVVGDIQWAKQTLSEQIPGYSPWSFACPFGSLGQDASNDSRIPGFLTRFLGRNFRAVFLTWPPDYSAPSQNHARLPRIEVHGDTGASRLYRWLKDRIPWRAKSA
jgi:hypothetical protein